jgi:hypothetical protein
MAANPAVALGILSGLAAGAFNYIRQKSVKRAALTAVIAFLALGTPLHFIIVLVFAGYHANKLLHRYLDRNWSSFIVSLLGLPVLFGVLQATGRLYVTLSVPGPLDLGGALAVGITMGLLYALLIVAGSVSYVLSSLYASYRRRRLRLVSTSA